MRGVGSHRRYLIGLCLLWPLWVMGQPITVTVESLTDRVQVGMPFQVELSVRHPENVVVVFPDSAAQFAPYEVTGKTPKPTQTSEGTSVDRALYDLLTWETDSLQYIQFSAGYIDQQGDTQYVASNKVEVLFVPVITTKEDTLKLKMHQGVLPVVEPVNWLLLLVIGFFGSVVLGLGIFILYKPIGRMFRRWRVAQEWTRFIREYEAVLPLLPKQDEYTTALSKAWKRYLDRSGSRSLAALTTQELQEALPHIEILDQDDIEVLVNLGRSRDRILYAGLPEQEEELRKFHAAVGKIMKKEYARRQEAAEV